MRVLLSWLREFAPLEGTVEDLAEEMSDLGMAVESIDRVGEGLDGVVVARVLDLRRHPDADRIQLVDVDAGDGEALQIACGAFNMAVGDLVPLATIGTVMPGGMEIARRKMRGEWSNGMLCAPDEIGLGGDHGGILILPADLEPGTPLREALGITADAVYDLEINPNRPDAMSMVGVARDLAARRGEPFTIPAPSVQARGDAAAADLATVEILAPDLCGRFVSRVLRGIDQSAASPAWLATRLTLAGMRPINAVVDASNYVMLELGQPNHPYDLDRLPGRGLRVRTAKAEETLVTLDDVERSFTADDLLICDADDQPVGIAGIMGGASAEIHQGTTDVLLEVAWFRPMAVARTSKRLGLRTEASARFERGCDPDIVELAANRFCQLVADGTGAGIAPGTIVATGDLPDRPRVRLRTSRLNAVLGTTLTAADAARYLDPIGFEPSAAGDDLDVVVPSWRPDSATEIDVIEEVARHHGYSRIPRTVPPSSRIGQLTPYQQDRRRVRQILVGAGIDEAWNSPFLAPGDLTGAGLDPEAVRVANPLAAEESLLRTSLLPGMLRTVAYNASHRNTRVSLFELGTVFRVPGPGAELPDEHELVAVALAGREAPAAAEIWNLLVDGLALEESGLEAATAPGLHPTRSALVSAGGTDLGMAGEIDPAALAAFGIDERVAWLEIDLGLLLAAAHGQPTYRPFSRFPSSDIDLAFAVDDTTPAGEVERTIRAAGGDLLASLRLFDVYRGEGVAEGQRSLAYSLRFQAPDRTLTDDDVQAARRRCIEAVESAHPATLRG